MISDWLVIKVTAAPGAGFFETIVALVDAGATFPADNRPHDHDRCDLCDNRRNVGPCSRCAGEGRRERALSMAELLVALLGALLPATAVVLVPLVRTSGVYGLLRANIVAKSAPAVEAAGRIDTVLLDKTGTITLGNRQAHALLPLPGVTAQRVGRGRVSGIARR